MIRQTDRKGNGADLARMGAIIFGIRDMWTVAMIITVPISFNLYLTAAATEFAIGIADSQMVSFPLNFRTRGGRIYDRRPCDKRSILF